MIPCSKEKADTPGLIPAIERYKGRVFRVLQLARGSSSVLNRTDIFILSGKYGLIRDSEPIVFYDQRMNSQLAQQHQLEACRLLQDTIEQKVYSECFVLLEPDYFAVLEGVKFPPHTIFETEISERALVSLSEWLLKPGDSG